MVGIGMLDLNEVIIKLINSFDPKVINTAEEIMESVEKLQIKNGMLQLTDFMGRNGCTFLICAGLEKNVIHNHVTYDKYTKGKSVQFQIAQMMPDSFSSTRNMRGNRSWQRFHPLETLKEEDEEAASTTQNAPRLGKSKSEESMPHNGDIDSPRNGY